MTKKLYLIGIFILAMSSAWAQTSTVKGTVTDQNSKEPLAGVVVEIKSLHMGTQTSAAGYFEFKNVPKGDYDLSFTTIGYNALIKKIDIDNGAPKVINVSISESTTQLNEVVVTGQANHESDVTARRKEKNAGNTVNVISAQTIAHSSDLNVADVSQRVSGVTLDRSADSKGEYVIIRGLEQRYNNTLINGLKVPSTDATSRSVPLQIIPSDLVGSLVVSKTLTPDMEEDAIGGTVDAELKDAPSEPLLDISVSGGYNQTLFNRKFLTFDNSGIQFKSPVEMHPGVPATVGEFPTVANLTYTPKSFVPATIESISFGRRFAKNKFGFIVSATNENYFSGSSSQYYTYYNDVKNNFLISDIINRKYSTQITNTGVNAKIDYLIDQKNKISFTGIYLRNTELSTRTSIDTNFIAGARSGPGTGLIDSGVRSRYSIQTLYNFSLQGKHSLLKTLTFNWNGSFADAKAETPDLTEFNVRGSKTVNGGPYQDGGQFVGGMTQIWQRNDDKDYTAKGDLLWAPNILNKHFTFQGGGLYRSKKRSNYNDAFNFYDSQIPQTPFKNISSVNFNLNPALGLGKNNPENYNADEQITAYYVETKFHFNKLEGIFGVRSVVTSQSNSYYIIPPGNPPYLSFQYYDYRDVLPSLNVKYSIDDKQDIRFGAYQALSRPNYFELVPYTIAGNGFDTKGNPNLQRTKANNVDLRYEIFPNAEDELLVGVYYKQLTNPIERSLFSGPSVGNEVFINTNSPTATNYGFEVNGIKYFGNFGVTGNYTFTESNIVVKKYLNVYDPTTDVISRVFPNESRPLQGQSKHVFNASLIYRDVKHGFNLNAAILFQGKRIDQISPEFGQDIYQSNFTLVSFSGDKTLGKIFSVFFKADNLTNSPYELYSKKGSFVQRDYFGQDYMIGIKAKIF